MNTIANILLNKKMDIDCTEQESAEIKGYFREFDGNELSKELAFFFSWLKNLLAFLLNYSMILALSVVIS